MTSKSKQTLLCVVAGILAVVLVFSLIRLHNYKENLEELYNISRIESAFYYTRDVYLKHDPEVYSNDYITLDKLDQFLVSKDEKWDELGNLVHAVAQNVFPNSKYRQEVSEKLDALEIYPEVRDGMALLIVDIDELKALTEEIENLPPELSDDSQDETQDYNTSEKP